MGANMYFSYPDDSRRIRLKPVLEGRGEKNAQSNDSAQGKCFKEVETAKVDANKRRK